MIFENMHFFEKQKHTKKIWKKEKGNLNERNIKREKKERKANKMNRKVLKKQKLKKERKGDPETS